jgi:hypothetical protein
MGARTYCHIVFFSTCRIDWGQESVKYAISSSEDTEAAIVTAIRSLIIAIIKNNMNPYYIWHSAKQKPRLL